MTRVKPQITMPKKDRELITGFLTRLKEMKKVKAPLMPVWKDITDYFYTSRDGWDFEDTSSTQGEKIFDGEAIAAHTKLKDGLFAWLCSPSIDWLKIMPKKRAYEDDAEVMRFCQDLEDALYDVLARSNFYETMAQDIGDCSALGTSVIYAEEDKDGDAPVFTPLHLREVYISEDRYGHVDTLYRVFEMANRHIIEQFGEEPLGESLAKAMKKEPDSRMMVLHVMEPRNLVTKGSTVFKGKMPYRSTYVLMGPASTQGSSLEDACLILEDGGMKYQRFAAWRFEHVPNSPYGNCVGRKAIYDTKMINIQSKTMADAAQLAAKPAYQAPESLRGKVRVGPGGITYRNGDEKVEAIQSGASYPLGIDSMNRRAAIIRELFLNDYFQSVSQIQQGSRERTKAEIMEMKAESASVLGTVIGRIESERLDPLIKLTIQMGVENGWLPKPPKKLGADFEFKVAYMGPLVQSQRKYVQTQGLTSGIGAAAQMAQMFGSKMMMNLKANEATRELMIASGLPYRFLEDKATVQKEQDAYDQQQSAIQQRQLENETLAAMGRGARAAEPGSPTAQAMGQQAAAAAQNAMNGGA